MTRSVALSGTKGLYQSEQNSWLLRSPKNGEEMPSFTLKDLNFSRCRRWILDAKSKQKIDPVFAYIAAWISFNHFYGTFASANYDDFKNWSNRNMSGSEGDKAQLMFLIQTKEFIDFFNSFKSDKKALFGIEVKLPVINLLNNQKVPNGIQGSFKLSDLQVEQIFQVIYQVRNNLFHGDKDPFKNSRDRELSKFGSEFVLLLISGLLGCTHGEVLDAFDDQLHEEIRFVAKIAKADLSGV